MTAMTKLFSRNAVEMDAIWRNLAFLRPYRVTL